MPEPTLENLQHVSEKHLGTEAISRIKDKHGADVRISRGEHVAALDYLAGHYSPVEEQRTGEGATFYIHPRYL